MAHAPRRAGFIPPTAVDGGMNPALRRRVATVKAMRPPALPGYPAGSHQPDAAGQQRLHHALLEGAGLGEFGVEGGDLRVHVGEDGCDGGLFG